MKYRFFFFQAEDGIRDLTVTGVQTCALPICPRTVDARQLDGLAGGAQPKPRNAGARSGVVCDLCHGFVADCGNCRGDIWQIADAKRNLASEGAPFSTEGAPARKCRLTFWEYLAKIRG